MAGSINCCVFFCRSVWGVSFKKKTYRFTCFLRLCIIWHRRALSTLAKQLKIVCAKQELNASMQQNPYRFSLKPRLIGAIQETAQPTAIP